MLFTPSERVLADAVRDFDYANPCDVPAQKAIRRRICAIDLEAAADEEQRPPVPHADPFTDALARRCEALLTRLKARIPSGIEFARDERERYEDLVTCAVYSRYLAPCDPLRESAEEGRALTVRFREFARDLAHWTAVPIPLPPFFRQPDHCFAIFFQHRLAVALLHALLRGASRPAERLRAAIWHSIFPRELRLYGVWLYERMQEVTTLILGPSGTGKELVATAIGLARFVPFNAQRGKFVEPFAGAFHALNLSAMPRDLIESEMFGHAAGAFTGALGEREGWFEKCKRGHSVFLDELGELEESVQVRLLRVLQNREFYRVGEAEPRRFEGRVIAATNRDLAALIAAGRFREDLYYRLCSDVIRTPTLREQLDDKLDELPLLVAHAARRSLGDKTDQEFVDQLTRDALAWIERSPEMGLAYPWPGNFRELEQCVRSVMVRGEYHPPAVRAAGGTGAHAALPAGSAAVGTGGADHAPLLAPGKSAVDQFAADVRAGRLTIDDLLTRYCSLVHARTENMAETARRLQKHRVTVQNRVDREWVERFRGN